MKLSIRLQNVGVTTVRFRIYSQHPDVQCSYTTPAGALAPGMKSTFEVTFSPKTMEYGDFQTEIHVVSQDEIQIIPLQGKILETWVES